MPSYYDINVAKDGRYLFSTREGGITTRAEADKVLAIMKEKFTRIRSINDILGVQRTYFGGIRL